MPLVQVVLAGLFRKRAPAVQLEKPVQVCTTQRHKSKQNRLAAAARLTAETRQIVLKVPHICGKAGQQLYKSIDYCFNIASKNICRWQERGIQGVAGIHCQ